MKEKLYLRSVLLCMLLSALLFIPGIICPGNIAVAADAAEAGLLNATGSWSIGAPVMTIKDYNTEYKLRINCDTSKNSVNDFSASSSDSSYVSSKGIYQDSDGYYVSLYKKGVGKSNITVYSYDSSYNKTEYTCTVTAEATDAYNWSLDQTTVTIDNSDTSYTLRVICDTSLYDSDSFRAESTDSSIVSVDSSSNTDGNGFYFTFKKVSVGTATITVRNSDAVDNAASSLTCTVTASAVPLTLDTASYTFDSANYSSYGYIYNHYEGSSDDYYISGVSSSNSSVADAYVYTYDSSSDYGPSYNYIIITAYKPGSTELTVSDNLGRTVVVTVKVEKSWVKKNLKYNTYGSYCYGEKYMYVYSNPGAKVTIKFDGKKYSKKINSSGYAKIKVGANHKYKSKYKVTASYLGYKAAVTGKTYTNSSLSRLYLPGKYNVKTIQVTASNVHKGDVIYVKCGGKTYSAKIKRNYSTTTVSVHLGKYPYQYTKFNVILRNKYGQKLTSWTAYYSEFT